MSTAFVPKHFPRTRLTSGRVLSDAQQHQYDVLRSIGGKLVSNRNGWWRVHSDTHREKIKGLNTTAMWSLVNFGLVVCVDDAPIPGSPAPPPGYLFLLPDLAKDVPGPRYERPNGTVKEKGTP